MSICSRWQFVDAPLFGVFTRGDGNLKPVINFEALGVGIVQDLQPLVLNVLFVGRSPNISDSLAHFSPCCLLT